jgi:NTE family protein
MEKFTLCLSGGGFRASLFHVGVVRRLIYLDLFKNINRINSVSGGSITAGLIMKELSKKPFENVVDFDNRVIIPLINFIQKSPRKAIYKIYPFNKDPNKFAEYLDKHLFNGTAFCELVKSPIWTCYATSLNSAQAWKFSQDEIGDSATGMAQPNHKDRISLGVVASACFPPLFRPYIFETHGRSFVFKYVNGKLLNTPNPSPPARIFLTDGGVYDNLGSESVLTKKSSFIVSDASGVTEHWRHGYPNKFLVAKRPIDIAMDQNGKLRRRLLFQSLTPNSVFVEASKPLETYTSKEVPGMVSPTSPEDMPAYPLIHRDLEKAIGLIRTDLNAFHDYEILTLIWNGMVKIDAVLKRWCPHLIKEEFWDDVPILNIENVTEVIQILEIGSKIKLWGKQHKRLNGNKKLVDHLSTFL